MMLPLALIWALLAPLDGSASATPIVLVSQLESVQAEAGTTVETVGWFQGWVGECLNLADTERCFRAAPGSNLAALKSVENRTTLFRFGLRAIGDGSEWEITNVAAVVDESAIFEEVRAATASDSAIGQAALIDWALRNVSRVPAYKKLALNHLEVEFQRLIASNAPRVADARALLEVGRQHQRSSRVWSTHVQEFANKHGATAEIAALLQEYSYVKSQTGWKTKEEFLFERGMIPTQDGVITIAQQLLQQESRDWLQQKTSVQLLRSLTRQQYQHNAKKRQVREGMNRSESVLAWGYPKDVTWLQRKGKLFELWTRGELWICMVEGHVFSWGE